MDKWIKEHTCEHMHTPVQFLNEWNFVTFDNIDEQEDITLSKICQVMNYKQHIISQNLKQVNSSVKYF